MKLEKPGPKKKKKLETKRLLKHNIEPPNDRRCVGCNEKTGTECYHHAESRRVKFLDGGGIMGGKINDRLSAWLCDDALCGVEFDKKFPPDMLQRVIDFHDLFTMEMIIKTQLLKE